MATRMKNRDVYAGDYLRVHIYPVRNYAKGNRGRKFRESSEAQKKYNDKCCAMRLADLLHANFTEEDFALRLSYGGECPSLEEAEKILRNFLRRLKYAYKKVGAELRYIYVTEQGKNGGRVHHHVVVNACPALTNDPHFFRDLWRNGGRGGASYAYVAPLEFATGEDLAFSDEGLTGLSRYIVFDKPKVTAKRYGRSRNLVEPEVRECIGAFSARQVKAMCDTGDVSALEENYEGYAVCAMEAEQFDASEPDSPPVTGSFVTVFLVRREMRFNKTDAGRKTRGKR